MPGNEVKNWPMYEALRRQGKSKEMAARIANSRGRGKPRSIKKDAEGADTAAHERAESKAKERSEQK